MIWSFMKRGREKSRTPISVPTGAQKNRGESGRAQLQKGVDTQSIHLFSIIKKTLLETGIPDAWVTHEVHQLNRGAHREVHIHLIIRSWSMQLLRHQCAIEANIRRDIRQHEQLDSGQEVLLFWRYARDCKSPFPDMPGLNGWSDSHRDGHAETPADPLERRRVPRNEEATTRFDNARNLATHESYAPTIMAPLSDAVW